MRVTGLSRDKFTMGNIHGYVKKKKETSHDILRGKWLGFFDTQGKRANQVCWARLRNDISQENMFYSWHVIEQWVVGNFSGRKTLGSLNIRSHCYE